MQQFIQNIRKKCISVDWEPFIPKLITSFSEGYSLRFFRDDLLAGLTVGVIALPLAMAFAIGSGVEPARGLYTAIIAGFLISLLGGSRYQIGGPTGAFVVIVYSIVERHGYDGLALATVLAGIILLIMGITKCGAFIRFIPYPVTTGFISGIATVLFVSQIKDFFGLQIRDPSPDFVTRLTQYWQAIPTINPYACLIGISSLAIIIYLRIHYKKIPGAIIAVIIASALTWIFQIPIPTIESTFGAVPDTLPEPGLPTMHLSKIQALFPDAIAIALLGAIESLLSCVVADTMTGTRHKSNAELLAQGIANIGSIFFGGIPATGAIARTTANVQLKAKSPISGIIHAATLFFLMFLFAPVAGKIPLAALSAILFVIAYNMSEMEHFQDICKGPISDRIVLLTTFLITVLVDLTVAAQAGILLAAFLFLKHMSERTTMKVYDLIQNENEIESPKTLFTLQPPTGMQIFEIEGPFFFGVADMLNEAFRQLQQKPKILLIRMRAVPLVDGSGIQALKSFYDKCTTQNIELRVTEVRPEVLKTLKKGGVINHIGGKHFFPHLYDAFS